MFSTRTKMQWIVPAPDDALANSKYAAMQIRKPGINDHVNLNTNSYYVFCFLIANKTFMNRSIENF